LQKNNKQNKICAIIVTYNRKNLLLKTLESIFSQSVNINSIFIINNGSTDDTENMLIKKGIIKKHKEKGKKTNESLNIYKFKNNKHLTIYYTKTSKNLGGAGGFHYGIKKAFKYNYKWFWILDDDISPEKNCLKNLLEHKNISRVLVPLRISKQINYKEFPAIKFNLKNPFLIDIRDVSFYKKYDSVRELPSLIIVEDFSFEGPLIHRDIIKNIGFPRKDIFISGDDTDYALKIRYKLKEKILLVTKAIIKRLNTSVMKGKTPYWKEYYLNRNYYFTHINYGENIFVKSKPFLLFIGLLIKNIVKLNFDLKKFKINFFAFLDAFKNPMPVRYKPGDKI